MITLGITGGIGSGKTTVCRMLEALGARVFYADDEAKRLMREDPELRAGIAALFGPEAYRPDGSLDRRHVAARVFGDEEKLRALNALVHPRTFRAFDEAREAAERDGVRLLVKEAALIFETGADRRLDAVAVVDAPQEERVRRVVERDAVSPDQVLARMGHQLPAGELRRRADFILENRGSLEALRLQVEAMYEALAGDRRSEAGASPPSAP